MNTEDRIARREAAQAASSRGVEVEGLIAELNRYRLIRCVDHWRLFKDGERIDGPWADEDVSLADEALSHAQAAGVLALLSNLRGGGVLVPEPSRAETGEGGA